MLALRIFVMASLVGCVAVDVASAQLRVTSLGKLPHGVSQTEDSSGSEKKRAVLYEAFALDEKRLVGEQLQANMGGNTSVRKQIPLEWKDKGYYQRNRDLGQVFVAPRDFVLEAIILRTGPGSAAYLTGTAGAPAFMQFFEVVGEPKIDDNGTPVGTDAKHGFSKNHRCDDFLRGVEYRPIGVVRGGTMPEVDGDGKLVYLKWEFVGEEPPRFEKGKRYAFMVGIEEGGEERGFTLANANRASSPEPPSLVSAGDTYPGGWGLRREGNGQTPPTMLKTSTRPTDPAQDEALRSESLFPEGDARFAISPTTDGYPDVDTYRDLEFYLISKP